MMEDKLQILLVEDNRGDAALLELSITESSYGKFEVTWVQRLEVAISRMGVTPWDAILLDLGLPDSQGLETLQRLRQSERHAPIIILTGLADESLALSAMQLGAQDYLVKSEIERGLVARALRYVIERRAPMKQSKPGKPISPTSCESARWVRWPPDWPMS